MHLSIWETVCVLGCLFPALKIDFDLEEIHIFFRPRGYLLFPR